MQKTNWRSIYLITAFTFLDGIQGSMFFISLWPYLNTVSIGHREGGGLGEFFYIFSINLTNVILIGHIS